MVKNVKLKCVNPLNANLVNSKVYEGRMYRTRKGKLAPTSDYKAASVFETKNENGKTIRTQVYRFMPV